MRHRAVAFWGTRVARVASALTSERGSVKEAPCFRSARLDDRQGMNREELIAAAHAGCFSMALWDELRSAGLSPKRINTTATVTSEKLKKGWTITAVMLDVVAEAPDATIDNFIDSAIRAKSKCAIFRLPNAKVSMNAKLER